MPKIGKKFEPGQGFTKEDWDEVSDNPEWTEEDFKNARPFAEVFPDMHASIQEDIRKRGPLKTKEAISIRLDRDLVERLRSTGPGWQSRINDALRDWLDRNAA